MDIVKLLGPQARARRNALRSLHAMRTWRENTDEAARAVSAALRDRPPGTPQR